MVDDRQLTIFYPLEAIAIANLEVLVRQNPENESKLEVIEFV